MISQALLPCRCRHANFRHFKTSKPEDSQSEIQTYRCKAWRVKAGILYAGDCLAKSPNDS